MIETTGNKQVYITGSGPRYPFSIPFFSVEDIHCYVYTAGDERELVAGEDYEVEVLSDYSHGSTVILLASVPAGSRLSIVREVELTQDVNLPEYGKIPTSALEMQLDKLVMICQQLKEITMRSFAVPHGMEDYDNEEIYRAFQQMVRSAEQWASQTAQNASDAHRAAAEAESSKSKAGASASDSATNATRALTYAQNAASAAGNAMYAAETIESIANQATMNRVSLAFGDWGSDGSYVSYHDWTPGEDLLSWHGQLEEHNLDQGSHGDLRVELRTLHQSLGWVQNECTNMLISHDIDEGSHHDLRAMFNSATIRELANTRCWVSPAVSPIKGTRTTIAHNLNLSEEELSRAVVEVRLKCLAENASHGYAVGDYAQWGVSASQYHQLAPVQPLLRSNEVSCVTGSYSSGLNVVHYAEGKELAADLSEWAYEFRIWY